MLPVSGYVLSRPWRDETALVLQSNHIDKNESRDDDLPININSLVSSPCLLGICYSSIYKQSLATQLSVIQCVAMLLSSLGEVANL